MANSFTANLNLEKPEVGADSNLWGGHINSDLDILDSIFTSVTTRPISSIIKSNTKIVDTAATSKAILFSLTSITAATTRNLTVQDADGTLAYTAQIAASTTGAVTTGQLAVATTDMATQTSAQTFANKTLTAPTINGGTLSATVTGVTTTALDNSTKLATTAYADNNLIQISRTGVTTTGAFTGTYNTASGTIPTSGGGTALTPFAVTFTPKSAVSILEIDIVVKGVWQHRSVFHLPFQWLDADRHRHAIDNQ